MIETTLPGGIVMAFAVNVLVGIYFLALYLYQSKQTSFVWWTASCFMFALGIAASLVYYRYVPLNGINVLACLLLFTASFCLFVGLNKFELSLSKNRLARQAYATYLFGILLIALSSLAPTYTNSLASVLMAVMFLLTEGCFYRRRSPFKRIYRVLRGILMIHAFVMFFQGVIMLLQHATQAATDIDALFQLTLLTHLLLTIITALVLPMLQIIRSQQFWKQQANIDSLTGLLNRRAFINKAFDVMGPNDIEHYCLLMVDVDHFKHINDEYGHQAGDEVLRQIAYRLRQAIRTTDVIGRIGGEEFAILMPNLNLDNAESVADRLLHAISEQTIRYQTINLQATVSIGIAARTGLAQSWDDLFDRADKALYSAKRSGRNLVSLDEASIA